MQGKETEKIQSEEFIESREGSFSNRDPTRAMLGEGRRIGTMFVTG
jgi:hypothetical protein